MGVRFIGKTAAELGVKTRTLRYYESIGVLPHPKRTKSGYRVYDDRTAPQVRFIAKAKSLGLTLREIRDIVTIYSSGGAPCQTVQHLLREHLKRIDRQMDHLRSLKAEIRSLLARWPFQCETDGNAVCLRIGDMAPQETEHTF